MRLRLAHYREKTPYAQADIADMMGVSPKTEWNWEQGKSFPNAVQIWNLAITLNCTPNDLLGWYDDHPRDQAPNITADEAEVLENYRACSNQWKRTISMTARAAAGETREEAESAARLDSEVSA